MAALSTALGQSVPSVAKIPPCPVTHYGSTNQTAFWPLEKCVDRFLRNIPWLLFAFYWCDPGSGRGNVVQRLCERYVEGCVKGRRCAGRVILPRLEREWKMEGDVF